MENKELSETIIALTIFLVMGFLLPLTAGLVGGGFENNDFKIAFYFYTGVLASSVIGIWIFRMGKQNNPNKFTAFIHDPDEGFLGNLGFIRKPLTLFAISLVLFSIIGLIGALTNTFFVSTPEQALFPSQQVSQGAELVFGTEPASSTETALFIFIMFIIMTVLNTTLFKNIKNRKWIYLFLIPIGIGLLWMGYHALRYGNVETALVYTFIFGFIGALMTMATGSIIPWWTWHFCNNLFFQANRMFTDDRIIVFTVILSLIIIIPIILVSISKKKKNKNG